MNASPCRIAVLAFLLGTSAIQAQWMTQEIQLLPGWNAVYLEAQPVPRTCDEVFAGLPIESVWAWNRRSNPVEFIQDTSELVLPHPDWLVYLPNGHPLRNQRTLHILEAGRGYLVKVATNAPATRWAIHGQPRLRSPDWVGGSFNFLGFPIPDAGPPRFLDFFASSPAVSNVFRLNTSGQWARVDAPNSAETMRRGEAFWAFAKTANTYDGPFRVTLDQRTGLEYAGLLQEQTVRVRNTSRTARTFSARLLASAEPAPGFPAVAGPVVMEYWDNNLTTATGGWRPFEGTVTSANLAPGSDWVLRLAVKRSAMRGKGQFQSILELRDGPNFLRALVPVTCNGLLGGAEVQAAAGSRSLRSIQAAPEPHFRAGLWVGSVTLTNVSRPASPAPAALEPTGSEFQFKLLVHVDAQGKPRLLQKVLLMWQDGTYKQVPDPIVADQLVRVVDTPGRYVLVTDDSLIPRFSGAALRDGVPVARRYSTVAFGFQDRLDLEASGVFGEADSAMTGTVVLPFDDPRNPFVHRFHPDHDNLNERFETDRPLGNGEESFKVTRRLGFRFLANDPSDLRQPGWGDSQVGGYYEESISGLQSADLRVSGIFRLHRASTVPLLNDGLESPRSPLNQTSGL